VKNGVVASIIAIFNGVSLINAKAGWPSSAWRAKIIESAAWYREENIGRAMSAWRNENMQAKMAHRNMAAQSMAAISGVIRRRHRRKWRMPRKAGVKNSAMAGVWQRRSCAAPALAWRGGVQWRG